MVVWYWLPQNNSLIKTSCNTRLINTMHMHTVWFWRVALKSYLYWPACGKINHIFWLRSHKLKSFKSLLNLKSSLCSLPPLWCSILWSVVEGVYCLWFIAVEVSQRFLDHFDCDQMFLFVDASELENINTLLTL